MPIIESSSGTVSFYERGAGTPIVLLHGIQGTARTWDAVTPLLESNFRVITPNLRGRGESSIPAEAAAYRLEHFASDLLAVLATIGRPAVLVAWSMGVSVTLELLRAHPDVSLRGLLLVSGSSHVGNEACWFHGTNADEVADEARERARHISLVEAAQPHAVAASWLNVREADFRQALPAIAIPTLVLHGLDDDQCPIDHGRRIARSIPGARLDEWADTGHNPMAKDPIRFADAVTNFVDSLST